MMPSNKSRSSLGTRGTQDHGESSDARVMTFPLPSPIRYANAITLPLSLQRAKDENGREKKGWPDLQQILIFTLRGSGGEYKC
ncbi:hypothetical protein Baya_7376 [Bagarius yarrelli]|uniref:Uncharacterized protein n=1 Tax=Bagarius yarrelli TaxID=175774 RepID=A0A556U1V9_BAGYA|nr:hypothetical protein Baya_7376 [Bagarius yarrelli]